MSQTCIRSDARQAIVGGLDGICPACLRQRSSFLQIPTAPNAQNAAEILRERSTLLSIFSLSNKIDFRKNSNS